MTEYLAASDGAALFMVFGAFLLVMGIGCIFGLILLARKPKAPVITKIDWGDIKPPVRAIDMAAHDPRSEAA